MLKRSKFHLVKMYFVFIFVASVFFNVRVCESIDNLPANNANKRVAETINAIERNSIGDGKNAYNLSSKLNTAFIASASIATLNNELKSSHKLTADRSIDESSESTAPCDEIMQLSNDVNGTSAYKLERPRNPCTRKICDPGYTCVVKKTIPCFGYGCPEEAVCVNPCDKVRCPSFTVCVSVKGNCDDPFCEPKAECRNICQGVTCANNQTCSAVYLECEKPPCPIVPLCGEDPCRRLHCPINQQCYLRLECKGDVCEIVPFCKNTCAYTDCPAAEYCYLEEVCAGDGINKPCYWAPFCKNPCDMIRCPYGTECATNNDIICLPQYDDNKCPPKVSCRPKS